MTFFPAPVGSEKLPVQADGAGDRSARAEEQLPISGQGAVGGGVASLTPAQKEKAATGGIQIQGPDSCLYITLTPVRFSEHRS